MVSETSKTKNREYMRKRYRDAISDPIRAEEVRKKARLAYHVKKANMTEEELLIEKTRRFNYRTLNLEKERKHTKNYYNKNKEKLIKIKENQRKRKVKQTPKWLTPEQLEDIAIFYRVCKFLNKVTGEKYTVDHIIPFAGNTVSGLHVPWNLQILISAENSSKGNKLVDNG